MWDVNLCHFSCWPIYCALLSSILGSSIINLIFLYHQSYLSVSSISSCSIINLIFLYHQSYLALSSISSCSIINLIFLYHQSHLALSSILSCSIINLILLYHQSYLPLSSILSCSIINLRFSDGVHFPLKLDYGAVYERWDVDGANQTLYFREAGRSLYTG